MRNKAELLFGTRSAPKNALVINLFGGPGVGKTTLAARFFAELKMRNIEAACPEEYAKIAIWQGRDYLLDNQLILVGRTWEMMSSLCDKVDVIILDSPILLGSHYAGKNEPKHFHDTVLDFHQRSDRFNFLVQRDPGALYSTTGRRENAKQAVLIDAQIQNLLTTSEESYAAVSPDQKSLTRLVDQIASIIEQRKSPTYSRLS